MRLHDASMSDLSVDSLSAALPGRRIRVYPALLSTEADALAWARSGAPAGAVVAADYQASPRGRAGREWSVRPGASLAFSLVLRPPMNVDREGWMYTVAVSGLADVCGPDATIEWPDETKIDGTRIGAVGIQAELGPGGLEWAVVNVIVQEARGPRPPLLAAIVQAIETRLSSVPADVLDDYLPRCETIGKRVRARLIPMGPSGVEVTGKAVGSLMDGALLIETDEGRRIAVRPQNLGLLEEVRGSESQPPLGEAGI